MTDIEQRVDELADQLRRLQRSLTPVGTDGLPAPTRHEVRDATDITGPRWDVPQDFTVIAMDRPDHASSVFLRVGVFGRDTGDVECMTPTDALQLAGALVAAANYVTDELAHRRNECAPRTLHPRGYCR